MSRRGPSPATAAAGGMLPELVTATEAARLGISASWLSAATRAGDLAPIDRAGRSARGSAVARYRLADVVALLDRRGRPYPRELVPPAILSPRPGPAPGDADDAPGVAESYASARARREVAAAGLAELRLRQARRELLPAADVRAWCGAVGALVQARVLGVATAAPTQIDRAGSAWLHAEVRDALAALADELEDRVERLLAGSTAAVERAAADAEIDGGGDDD